MLKYIKNKFKYAKRSGIFISLFMMVSVILSTYNQPRWLRLVLWGYKYQTTKDFELVIADDGSDIPTREVIESMRQEITCPIKHVYQEDMGFRKCTILNKAVLESTSDYLIFSDGDLIPRMDFIAVHLQMRQPGRFLSGGTVRLPAELSGQIGEEEIGSGLCFERRWLEAHGLKRSFKNNKLNSKDLKAWLLNTFTPTGATWNGGNASAWKNDIMDVRGFDERLCYGGEDREFGERLERMGVKGRQIRYSAITLHLDHPRGYIHLPALEFNRNVRRDNRKEGIIRTEYGLNNH